MCIVDWLEVHRYAATATFLIRPMKRWTILSSASEKLVSTFLEFQKSQRLQFFENQYNCCCCFIGISKLPRSKVMCSIMKIQNAKNRRCIEPVYSDFKSSASTNNVSLNVNSSIWLKNWRQLQDNIQSEMQRIVESQQAVFVFERFLFGIWPNSWKREKNAKCQYN